MVYRAIGKGNVPGPVTVCPKQAAREFFAAYPLRRKCNVFAGSHAAGRFVAATYKPGEPIPAWRDVTRQTIERIEGRGNV